MKHEHTDQCQRQHTFAKVERARYTARWPRYCHTCKGEGALYYTYDPSPAGVSLAPGSMEDCDPCPDCVERGICPRCGEQVWDDDSWDMFPSTPLVCGLCGWNEHKSNGLPPEGECCCWAEWERKELVDWAAWHDGVPAAGMMRL